MKQSDNIANLAKALINAHKAVDSAVVKNSKNETFASGYADLKAVIEAVKIHLNTAGIVVIQSPTLPDLQGNVSLTTRLIHETGEWMEDTCSTPMAYLDPQGFGSAISYLRRYALAAMMGLYQSDDDGAAATGNRGRSGAAAASANDAPINKGTPKSAAPAVKTAVADAQVDAEHDLSQEMSEPVEDLLPPDIQKRVDAWQRTIANASLERLETSRTSAKTTFKGRAFEIVDKAFQERIDYLRESAMQAA